jgi:hypothetical protein
MSTWLGSTPGGGGKKADINERDVAVFMTWRVADQQTAVVTASWDQYPL